MAATQGYDVKMAYKFPQGTSIESLNALFNKPGVSNYSAKASSTGIGTRRRAATGGQVYVTATIHYPHPLLDIEREIETHLGKFGQVNLRKKNLTDYDSVVNNTGIQNLTTNTAVNDIAALFGNVKMFGGKRRKARKTRKANKRRH
jgi:hypothetical protein